MKKDTLLEFAQGATRPDEAHANRGWKLCTDGRAYTRRNPADAVRPLSAEVFWFVAEWPEQPKKLIPKFQVDAIRDYLATQAHRPPYERKEAARVQGGSWFRVSLRTPDGPRVLEVNAPHYAEIDALLMPVLDILRPPS